MSSSVIVLLMNPLERDIFSSVLLGGPMFAVVITGSLSMLRKIIEIPSGISLLSGAGIIAGFSYLMWYAANKRIGCARGMAANSTYVIWGVLINALFWGEPISAQTLAGCVCVLAGVILVSMPYI